MNAMGGHRADLSVALTGLDVEAKAALAEEAFWIAMPDGPDDFESVESRIVRTDKIDPASNEEAVAQWCLTLKDADERKVGRGVFNAMTEMALSTIPGFFSVRSSIDSTRVGNRRTTADRSTHLRVVPTNRAVRHTECNQPFQERHDQLLV